MEPDDKQILVATLHWLRNHYEFGRVELKGAVLDRVDRVLEQHELTVEDMRKLRELFPINHKPKRTQDDVNA